uniref:Uncharacterized protein n=1 Tax=Erpetoichthys calabaricus TaxID=27687 RepID=A0A8C4S156_ERPCA
MTPIGSVAGSGSCTKPSKGFILRSPLALAHNNKVSLSFTGLWPGIFFSSWVMYVLLGIFFQKSPVSSQSKT